MISQTTANVNPIYALRYSRVQKTWLILTADSAGNVIDTERAGRCKLSATLEILGRVNPLLQRLIIETAGQELDRAEATAQLIKAAGLVLGGNVFEAEVRSQTDENVFYRVKFTGTPKQYACTCPHFRTGGHRSWALGKVCKHILASHLAWRLGITLSAPPVPVVIN